MWLQNVFSTDDSQADFRRGYYIATVWKQRGAWKWHITDLRLPVGEAVVETGRGTYTRSSSARAAAEAALSTRADVALQDY